MSIANVILRRMGSNRVETLGPLAIAGALGVTTSFVAAFGQGQAYYTKKFSKTPTLSPFSIYAKVIVGRRLLYNGGGFSAEWLTPFFIGSGSLFAMIGFNGTGYYPPISGLLPFVAAFGWSWYVTSLIAGEIV